MKKQNPTTYCTLTVKTVDSKWMEKDLYHSNNEHKGAVVALVILAKVDFKTKSMVKDKERHIMMKGSINQESVTITGIHMPNKLRETRGACIKMAGLGK